MDSHRAVDHALELEAQGADLLDIGGESTRPYAPSIDAEEELRRVTPVLRRLARQAHVPISIDTSKAAVARAALDAGVEIINDVTGLQADPEMIALAKSSSAAVCVMHMQGTPQTMQDDPAYRDVLAEVRDYLRSRRDALIHQGIDPARICVDPGIGFGKTQEHSLTLLANCRALQELRCPILVGHSQKGFIGKVLEDKDADRLAGTIGVACSLAAQGVHVLRVHDVEPVRQALELFVAAGGIAKAGRS